MTKEISKRTLVIAGLIVILFIRLGLAWIAFKYPERSITIDSAQYLQLAEGLRLQGKFEATEYLEEVRTPGYPLLLTGIQYIFGNQIGVVILIQLFMTILIAWLLYRWGKLFDLETIGLGAAWFYALNPNAIFWSLTVLTETFFSLLLLLSFFTLTIAYKREQGFWLLISGLLLGFATITRPIGLYLIPIWGILTFLILRSRMNIYRVLGLAVLFLAAAMLLVLYWQTRNYLLKGNFSLSTTTEVTISRFIAADTLADALDIDRDKARLMILNEPDPMAYSFKIIRQHPISFIRVTARGIVRTALGTEVGTWTGILLDQPYQGSGFLTALVQGDWSGVLDALKARLQGGEGFLGFILLIWGVAYSFVLYLLIGWGIVRVFHFAHPNILHLRWASIILMISAAYLILIPLGNGDSRFRVPAEPLLALLGGFFFLPRHKSPSKKIPVHETTAKGEDITIQNDK